MKKNILHTFALAIIGCLSISGLYAQEKTFKVLSYNVYWGMKQDTTLNKSLFAKWIKEQDADVVALQEMNGFTQQNPDFAPKGSNPNNLQKLAESYGHPYVYIVREPAPDGAISFPVAITSKYPIINVKRVTDNMTHGLLVAEIEGYHFLVTHFHPFSAAKRGNEVDLVLAHAKSIPNAKLILMGDLNSPSPLDKSEYDNGLFLKHAREEMKKKPHYQNLTNNELDYSIQQRVLDAGFVDALKIFHPQFTPTCPSKLVYDQSPLPLRYDMVYVSSNMKKDVIKCDVIKDDFTDWYSDHYPVLLIINK